MRAADATPGRGDFWILKIAYALSPKNLSKNGLPQKGVAFLTEDVFAKKFLVPAEIPLAALAPARRAAAASEPKAPPCRGLEVNHQLKLGRLFNW